MKKIITQNLNGLKGIVTIPPDKSISHRAIMLATIADGKSIIKNFSKGKDPISSLNVCELLGVKTEYQNENNLIVYANGKLNKPSKDLDCGNSGTTMRLMAGLLAGQKFNSILKGDESLNKRPMKRIIEPLTLMGADILAKQNKAPLKICGKILKPINYNSKLASAQVKSCILLAGLKAEGITKFTEPYISRNHSEIMLKFMNADIKTDKNTVAIGKSVLEPRTIEVCGDISSAAYFIVAALIVPNSNIILKNVGLNPTRTGILEIALKMGGDIKILDKKIVSGEEVGDLEIKTSELKGCIIEGDIIPKLIDELPVIAVLATQATGETIVKDAKDLRNKESDRIKTIVCELKKLGAEIEERDDGFVINGETQLQGGVEVESYQDHRLAMSLYVAGLICKKDISIKGFEWVDISFPEFDLTFNKLC